MPTPPTAPTLHGPSNVDPLATALSGPAVAEPARAAHTLAAQAPDAAPNAARRPRWLKRSLMVGTGVLLFVVVGSVIDPDQSDAQVGGAAPAALIAGSEDEAWPRGLLSMPALIGVLESPDFRILIHAGDPDPLYTVCTPSGRVLMAELRADEVYREFPMIDPTKLRVDPPETPDAGPLMLAWPMD